jgi:hypothetical protein
MFILLISACSTNKSEDHSIITKRLNCDVNEASVSNNTNVSESSVTQDNSTKNNYTQAADLLTEQSSEVTQNTDNIKFNFSKGYFNERDIIELFSLTKKQIEFQIGTEYEIFETGAEESFTSYTYSKHDISIFYITNDTVEDTSDDYVDFIECGKTLEFNGVQVGMTFKQIKEIFPNTVIKNWSSEEDDEIVYYEIEFSISNLTVDLVIQNENSPTTGMTIYRK